MTLAAGVFSLDHRKYSSLKTASITVISSGETPLKGRTILKCGDLRYGHSSAGQCAIGRPDSSRVMKTTVFRGMRMAQREW